MHMRTFTPHQRSFASTNNSGNHNNNGDDESSARNTSDGKEVASEQTLRVGVSATDRVVVDGDCDAGDKDVDFETKQSVNTNFETAERELDDVRQREAEIAEVVREAFLRSTMRQRFESAHDETLSRRLRKTMRTNWVALLNRLSPLGGASRGNHLHLFTDGTEAYKEMLTRIQTAKHRVWMEMYTVELDQVGATFVLAMADAKRRGCDVRLCFDAFGSLGLEMGATLESYPALDFLRPLVSAGAEVFAFNQMTRLAPWRKWSVRNHRKLLICDDIAFTGGMNIGRQYCGKGFLDGTDEMVDASVMVSGPAVEELSKLYLDSTEPRDRSRLSIDTSQLQQAATARTKFGRPRRRGGRLVRVESAGKLVGSSSSADGVFVQVLPADSRRKILHIQTALRLTLRSAMEKCYLTTPYFVPPRALKNAILMAARRGADVRIMVAGRTDVLFHQLASQHIASQFLRAGVKIYEMQDKIMHAKTVAIDGIYASVGSFNLDHWSHERNLEVNLTAVDPALAEQLEQRFEANLPLCRQVTLEDLRKRPVWEKFVGWAMYHIVRITR